MNFSRSNRKAIRFASLAVLTAISVSACVATVVDYDDGYYPEERTVVVKHARPVVNRVDVYEPRPHVIYTHPYPAHYSHHRINHYYTTDVAPPSVSAHVIVRPHSHRPTQETVVINPGRHQQQQVIVKPYGHRHEVDTTVVKDYRHNSTTTVVRSPYNNETRAVLPPSTEVKHPKKIVIESQEAPPSTLAE